MKQIPMYSLLVAVGYLALTWPRSPAPPPQPAAQTFQPGPRGSGPTEADRKAAAYWRKHPPRRKGVKTMATGIAELAQAESSIVGTTLTATVPTGGVAQNSRVVVCFGMPATDGVVSCADDGNNTYAVDADVTNASGYRGVMLSAPVTTFLAPGDSITITCPSVSDRAGTLFVITGLDGGGQRDQFATATGNSDAPTSGPIMPTAAEEALVAFFVRAADPALFTAGTGWTQGAAAMSTGTTVDPVYRVAHASGTYTADGAYEVSAYWSAAVASYKTAGEEPEPPITQASGYPWNVVRRRRLVR